jgi:hypothetical protein
LLVSISERFTALTPENLGPNTNNSQFFICLAELPHLNNQHVVVGRVTEGIEVVKVIEMCGSESGHTSRSFDFPLCWSFFYMFVCAQRCNNCRLWLSQSN